MRRLYTLATKLHQANYIVTDEIRNEFEEYLSIVTEGARILHPRFGLGTVLSTTGETWVNVKFDNQPYRKMVQITSCTSIHMLLKNEMKRDIFNK